MKWSLPYRHDAFHFAKHAFRQVLDGDAGAGRLAGEIFSINRVKGGKVRDVRQETGGLHDAGEVRALAFKQCLDVGHDLLGLFLDGVAHHLAGRRGERNLAGKEGDAVYDDSL